MTREEAIERLKNYTQYRCSGVDLIAINMAIQALEQEPKTGHWIGVNPMVDTLMCSECGENIISEEFKSNYCPNCGARMIESESKFFAKVAESYCKGLRDGLTVESEE